MGNILGLLRYGQTGTDSYGLIDNLNPVSYTHLEHVTTENMLTFRFLIFLQARTTLSWMVLQMEK